MDERIKEKTRSTFAGVVGTNLGRTFDAFVTPTFEADGLNTANVNPVDVASSLNASPMMSKADPFSIIPTDVQEPKIIPIMEDDLFTKQQASTLGQPTSIDVYVYNPPGANRLGKPSDARTI